MSNVDSSKRKKQQCEDEARGPNWESWLLTMRTSIRYCFFIILFVSPPILEESPVFISFLVNQVSDVNMDYYVPDSFGQRFFFSGETLSLPINQLQFSSNTHCSSRWPVCEFWCLHWSASCKEGWEDSSVSEVPAMQAWGLEEFRPPCPCEEPGVKARLQNSSSERWGQEHTHFHKGMHMRTQTIPGFMGEPPSIQFILFFSFSPPNTAH